MVWLLLHECKWNAAQSFAPDLHGDGTGRPSPQLCADAGRHCSITGKAEGKWPRAKMAWSEMTFQREYLCFSISWLKGTLVKAGIRKTKSQLLSTTAGKQFSVWSKHLEKGDFFSVAVKPGRDFTPVPVLFASTPGITVRWEAILYLLQVFLGQESCGHPPMGGRRCSCGRATQAQGLWGKLVGQCCTCVHLPGCLPPSPPAIAQQLGTAALLRKPPPPPHHSPEDGAAAETSAAALTGSLRGDDAQKWSHLLESKPSPLHPACPPKPSPAPLRLWATEEVSLQSCEGDKRHLTNIYANECTSVQIYTLARGSCELQGCRAVLGSCRSAASQSRSLSLHKTACCNFYYCCFLQSFQVL